MIRIITNGENNSKTFFKVKRMQDLLQFGIESKIVNLKEGFMHNKFAIIDDSILINGSLNWTENAIFNNFEDVLITSNSKLVFTYLLKFNSLWSDSSH
jgi:phosphatidylserine/phosphatidylglycerophosphate/cardiolipin synthase-like enzyme